MIPVFFERHRPTAKITIPVHMFVSKSPMLNGSLLPELMACSSADVLSDSLVHFVSPEGASLIIRTNRSTYYDMVGASLDKSI